MASTRQLWPAGSRPRHVRGPRSPPSAYGRREARPRGGLAAVRGKGEGGWPREQHRVDDVDHAVGDVDVGGDDPASSMYGAPPRTDGCRNCLLTVRIGCCQHIAAEPFARRHVIEEHGTEGTDRDVAHARDTQCVEEVLECGVGRSEDRELATAVEGVDEARATTAAMRWSNSPFAAFTAMAVSTMVEPGSRAATGPAVSPASRPAEARRRAIRRTMNVLSVLEADEPVLGCIGSVETLAASAVLVKPCTACMLYEPCTQSNRLPPDPASPSRCSARGSGDTRSSSRLGRHPAIGSTTRWP